MENEEFSDLYNILKILEGEFQCHQNIWMWVKCLILDSGMFAH